MSCNVLAVVVANTQRGAHEVPLNATLAGLAQVEWTVRAAKAAPGVAQVWVVTDDMALCEPARRAGADSVWCEVHDAPQSLDLTLWRALQKLEDAQGPLPTFVLCLDAAFPLTRACDLAQLLTAAQVPGVDGVCAAFTIRGRAVAAGTATECVTLAADALDDGAAGQWLVESGAAYVVRPTLLRSTGRLRAGCVALQALGEHRQLRVVSALDRSLAEVVLRQDAEGALSTLLPSRLQAVVFDFDGVMTDNAVWVTQDGHESVRCDRGDGMGLGMLRARGIELLILSKERNPVVRARASKLGIECLQGIDNKLDELQRWLAQHDLAASDTVYVGNDVNDLECMRYVGCAACPQDAHVSAREASRLVLTRDGGRGAVRELCDLILASLSQASGRAAHTSK